MMFRFQPDKPVPFWLLILAALLTFLAFVSFVGLIAIATWSQP